MKLTHAQRGAVGVEAMMPGIADEIGGGLMRADVFQQQRISDAVDELAIVQSTRRIAEGKLHRGLILGQAVLEVSDELFPLGVGEVAPVFRWHFLCARQLGGFQPSLEIGGVGRGAEVGQLELTIGLISVVALGAMLFQQSGTRLRLAPLAQGGKDRADGEEPTHGEARRRRCWC